MTRGRIVAGLLAAAAMAALGASVLNAQTLEKGMVFPPFTETDMRTGKPINLEDFRGKVVLVDFWATWCGPCMHEIPGVKKAYEEYHDKGFDVISISLDRDIGACKEFVEKEKMDWHHIADGKFWDAKLARKHKVRGIPMAVLVGRDGKIITTNARGPALEQGIEEGLKQEWNEGTKAEESLAQADKLRKDKQYLQAIELYDEIAKKYSALPAGKTAKQRADEMRADPEIAARIEQAQREELERKAAQEGETWLRMARQMVEVGKPDKARKYYARILDKYPGTEVAKVAEKEMSRLRG